MSLISNLVLEKELTLSQCLSQYLRMADVDELCLWHASSLGSLSNVSFSLKRVTVSYSYIAPCWKDLNLFLGSSVNFPYQS